MDSFILVNEAREAEFQMSKLDFINPSNKAEIRSPQPPHLNLCLSAHPFYTCCTAQTWEFLFFNWLCLSGLPPIIYYHTWSSFNCGIQSNQSFFYKRRSAPFNMSASPLPSNKDFGSGPRRHTSELFTCVLSYSGTSPKVHRVIQVH